MDKKTNDTGTPQIGVLILDCADVLRNGVRVVVEGVVEGALVIVSFTEVPFVDEPKNKTKIQKL